MTSRWIAHLDMDAFYASVELLRYPELRGKPVVVGGRRADAPLRQPDGSLRFHRLRTYAGRGVVTTATYEARALGVRSGMGLMKSAALAPDAVLLPADFDEYRRYSRLFKAAVAEVAPVIEDRGIDEIFIDLTSVPGVLDSEPGDAHAGLRSIARWIKTEVRRATGLTCSIGISPNKLLSKLCSELDKPDGLTILSEPEIPLRIWPLDARQINGIGPKAAAKLELIGIRTIGELAAIDPRDLVRHFGANFGAWLHEAAHGRDNRAVVTERDTKSISRETTFERDLHVVQDRAELGAILSRLCEQLALDLEKKGYRSRTIGVKLRFEDFKIVTRVLTLPAHVRDAASIRRAAGQCLKSVNFERRLRLIGVRADNLCREDSVPEPERIVVQDRDQLSLPM